MMNASVDRVFTFVPDGIESALAKAQEVAADKRIRAHGRRSSTSNTSPRGSWTRSESTWSTSCSEEAAGCSTSSRGKSELERTGVTETHGAHLEYHVRR